MKLSKNTIAQLRQLLANAAFNANNITIADHVAHTDKLEIFFELKDSPVETLDEAVLLTLDVEDADEMIGMYYGDGLAYGYEYFLQIGLETSRRFEVDAILKYIQGYVFMAARTAKIEANLAAMAVLRGEVA